MDDQDKNQNLPAVTDDGGVARVLSERDAALFLRMLDEDPEPNNALRAAAERYRVATQRSRS